MYRVLQKVIENGVASTYAFVTKVENKKTVYREFASKQEVDEYVEFQINGGIPKTSLEVVEYVPYTVTADLLDNSLYTPAPATVYTLLNVPTTAVIGAPTAFRIDCDVSKFTGVKVNGVPIHNSMYTVTSGSTVIEFKAEYMAQLEAGDYTFSFIFTDGVAESTVHIDQPTPEEEEPTTPPTDGGDGSDTTPETPDDGTGTEGGESESGSDAGTTPTPTPSEGTEGGATEESTPTT